MNSTKLNDWLQVIGIFGVIASLIFVGVQMQQTQEIALSATYQARTAIAIDSLLGQAAIPEWSSATAKIYKGKNEDLTSAEVIALEAAFVSSLLMWENIHYQFESGFISGEHWERTLRDIDCYFEQPLYREMYSYFSWRDSFSTIVDRAIENSIENPTGCWDFTEGSYYDRE